MKTKKQLINFEHKGNEKHSFKLRPTLLSLCMLTFIGGYSQTGRVSLNLKNATVKELFKEIEKQTPYRFSYRDIEIKDKGGINISGQKEELKVILTNELAKQQLSYTVSGNKIIVSPIKKTTKSVKKFTGKVINSKNEPIIGATIMEKGTTNGTITDLDGNFMIDASENAMFEISYIGYQTQSVKAISDKILAVTLKEDTELLDEVVVVGYGTQRKGNLTGSISDVKSERLTVAPIANVSNALAGQLPGLVARQNNGQPGSDGASLSIRGFGAPLVIVDGVESDFTNLDASQIESITILKDGAASIYGARAGNGVMLVTTKRGTIQKPTITFNSSLTIQGVTNMLKPASSGQRAQMERETHLNSGKDESSAPWSEEAIEKFFAGNDPDYPNEDWYNVVFRKWAPQQNHNVSVRGGNDKIKYYGFFGYTTQSTIIKENGGNFNRYNLQANMDAEIIDGLQLTLDFSANMEDRIFPIRGIGEGGMAWGDLYDTKPWFSASLPDPTKQAYGGAVVGSVAICTNYELAGYNKNNDNELRTNGALTYEFKNVKGLKAKAFISYQNYNSRYKSFNKPVTSYTYNYKTDSYTEYPSYFAKASMGQGSSNGTRLTQQYSLTYDNTFNNIHRLSVLGLYECINYYDESLSAGRSNFTSSAIDQIYAGSTEGMTNDGRASEMGRASYVGRLNYSLMDRYLIETIVRADASAKFAKSKRWGVFPSISLGWVISEENFLKEVNAIDNIKLRASYGQSGNDGVGNFQYLTGYGLGGGMILGGSLQQMLSPLGMANMNLSWEKMSIYNGGIDFSLLNRKIYGTAEGFYRLRSGIPATRNSSLPSTFGASLPVENLNELDDRGFEFSIGTMNQIGDLFYDLSGNISWSRSKWKYYEEPNYEDPDQIRINKATGNWTDRIFGYKSDKLFASQEEIDNLPYVYEDLGGNGSLRPGDVKYIDINGDGVLNWRDKVNLGSASTPHWMYGFSGILKYKDFDMSFLFQGAFDYITNIGVINDSFFQTSIRYDLRWTAENNNINSIIPRIGGSSSNGWSSDFYNRKTSYLRLKNFSIGYNVPENWLNKINIQKLRIYLAATNLFTLSNVTKYGIDPEIPGQLRYYPQQRTISLGLNLSF